MLLHIVVAMAPIQVESDCITDRKRNRTGADVKVSPLVVHLRIGDKMIPYGSPVTRLSTSFRIEDCLVKNYRVFAFPFDYLYNSRRSSPAIWIFIIQGSGCTHM
jgi:hypothetical protein